MNATTDLIATIRADAEWLAPKKLTDPDHVARLIAAVQMDGEIGEAVLMYSPQSLDDRGVDNYWRIAGCVDMALVDQVKAARNARMDADLAAYAGINATGATGGDWWSEKEK